MDKLYGAGVRRFFIMGAPPLHDAPTMRVMAPSLAASDLGRLAALGLQTSLDAQTQVLPLLITWIQGHRPYSQEGFDTWPAQNARRGAFMAASNLGRPGRTELLFQGWALGCVTCGYLVLGVALGCGHGAPHGCQWPGPPGRMSLSGTAGRAGAGSDPWRSGSERRLGIRCSVAPLP